VEDLTRNFEGGSVTSLPSVNFRMNVMLWRSAACEDLVLLGCLSWRTMRDIRHRHIDSYLRVICGGGPVRSLEYMFFTFTAHIGALTTMHAPMD
jgi:hypothetical protein